MATSSVHEGGHSDARYERDHGGAVPAEEARRRARVRRSKGMGSSADYWDAYAAEVELWARTEEAQSDPRAAGTSHLGIEAYHDGKRYHLAKYGPNWVVNLGTDASRPSNELARWLLVHTDGEPVHYVTDDDSVSGILTAWWRTDAEA
jgi:hypothetical protein